MKINPRDILPEAACLPREVLGGNYKSLGEKDVIKIQKFFIKKLIEKIPR